MEQLLLKKESKIKTRQIIYNKNCIENINLVENNSVDLIVCDGPYNSTEHFWDKIKNIQEYNLNLIRIFTPKLKKVDVFIYLVKVIVLTL